jgi:hypothetical protein
MLAYKSLTIFVEFLEVIIDSRSLIIVTMLGVIAFVSKGMLPSPIDKMFVLVACMQALLTRNVSFLLRAQFSDRIGAARSAES